MSKAHPDIPGTVIFDGAQAMKGYALNKMCFSFNDETNRKAFLADEEAYMRKYGLNEQQAAAIRAKNVLQLIAAGGNAYYLVRVRTKQSRLADDLPIIPGMVAQVDILTGKKTVLAYLMKPVLRAKANALRER